MTKAMEIPTHDSSSTCEATCWIEWQDGSYWDHENLEVGIGGVSWGEPQLSIVYIIVDDIGIFVTSDRNLIAWTRGKHIIHFLVVKWTVVKSDRSWLANEMHVSKFAAGGLEGPRLITSEMGDNVACWHLCFVPDQVDASIDTQLSILGKFQQRHW